MTVPIFKTLALGGLCALVLGSSSAASAQGYSHHHSRYPGAFRQGMHRGAGPARRHLQVLHAVYNHEIKSGHPEAAMKAHLRAKAIRSHIRARR